MKKNYILLFLMLMGIYGIGISQITIGTGTNESQATPIEPYYNYSYSQSIYLSSEISTSGSITSISYYFSGTSSLTNSDDLVDIYIGHTTKSSFSGGSDWEAVSGLTQVFSGSLPTTSAGWIDITLDVPFSYNGTDNLLVAVDANEDGYDSSTDDFHNSPVTGDRSNTYRSDTTNPDPASPPSGTTASYIPNIILGGISVSTPPNCDATLTSASSDFPLTGDLTWSAANGGPTGYFISVGSTMGGTDIANNVDVMANTSYTPTGLMYNTTYYTTITPYNAIGNATGCIEQSFTSEMAPPLGSDCNTPLIISSLPYSETGATTDGFGDDYSGSPGSSGCGSTSPYLNGDDIVYSYTPASNGCININLSGITDNYTGMFLYTDCADIGNSCIDGVVNGFGTNALDILNFSVDAGQTYYIVISTYALPQTTGYTLDIEDCPSCPVPTSLTANNTTENSAELSWTEIGTATAWNIEYGAPDFTEGNGTTITGVTNPYTLTGLTADTDYDYYVQADCGGETSNWSTAGSFTTLPAPPACGGTFYDSGGSGGDYSSNEDITTTICPDNAGDVVTVTFTSFDTESGWDFLDVYNGDDSTAPNLGSFSGTTIPGPFTSTDASGCLTFVFDSDGSGIRSGWVAGVTCAAPPSCPVPTSLTSDNITENSADLAWTENGGATSWNIEYGAPDFTPGMGTQIGSVITTSDNPYTLSGLTAETEYDWYVQADCSGDLSDWSAVGSFTTAASPPANDECANPITLTLDEGTTCGANIITGVSNDGATDSGEGTPSCGDYSGRDLFYSITVPADITTVTLNTSNLSGLTSVAGALYSGSCGSLSEIDCTEFSGGWPWTINGLTSGETYILRLWDYSNNETGTFDLCGYYEYECSIASITHTGSTTCNENLYDATFDVTYNYPPTSGQLSVEVDGNTQTFAITSSPQTITMVDLAADGTSKDVLVEFTDDLGCFILEEDLLTAPAPCACLISDISDTGTGIMNCSGTTFDYEVDITYGNAPAGESINVTAGTGSGSIASPMTGAGPFTETVTISGITTGTGSTDVIAEFSTSTSCTLTETGLISSPDNCPPSNDVCINAKPLDCTTTTSYTGETTVGSTDNGDDTGCAMGVGVWYVFNGEGTITINTMGDYDHELSVSSSNDCTTFNNEGCSDAIGNNEEIEFTAVSGTDYYIYVGAWSGTGTTTGTFDISVSCTSCVEPAFTIEDGGNNCPSPQFYLDVDVTDTGSGTTVDISDGTTTYETGVGIGTYNLGPFGEGTTVDVIVSDNGDITCFDVQTYTTPTVCPPANDDLCNAETLTIDAAPTTGNNTFATIEGDEPQPNCWLGTYDETVWFEFTADDNGPLIVSTEFPSNELSDTQIAIYTASDCSDLTTLIEIGCDDDGGDDPSLSSIIEFAAITGTTYYVQVEGYSSNNGEFMIQVTSESCDASSNLALASSNMTLTPGNSCTDDTDGYTYYGDGSGSYFFAIDWGTTNDAAKAAAEVIITVGTMGSADDGSQGTWTMGRYWNVDLNGTSLADNVDVKFYYDADEKTDVDDAASGFSSSDGYPVEDAKWFKTVGADWNGAPSVQNPAEGVIELTANETTEGGIDCVEFTGIASFSGGTYASGVGPADNALPIKLLSFTAAAQGKVNMIEWETASQSDVDFMSIERSENGKDWSTLGKVTDVKNTSRTQQYDMTDPNPKNLLYYRLKSVDYDGTVETFEVVKVRRTGSFDNGGVVLKPNPVMNTATIQFTSITSDNVDISILDVNGRVVRDLNVAIDETSFEASIDLQSLNPGVYFVNINNTYMNEIIKFIKL